MNSLPHTGFSQCYPREYIRATVHAIDTFRPKLGNFRFLPIFNVHLTISLNIYTHVSQLFRYPCTFFRTLINISVRKKCTRTRNIDHSGFFRVYFNDDRFTNEMITVEKRRGFSVSANIQERRVRDPCVPCNVHGETETTDYSEP